MTLDQIARVNLLLLWPLLMAALAVALPVLTRRIRSSPAERDLVSVLLGAGALLGCFALAASLLWEVAHADAPFLVDYGQPGTPWQLRLLFDRAGGLALVVILALAGAGLVDARAELRDPRAVARCAAALALVVAALVIVALPVLAIVCLLATALVAGDERPWWRAAGAMVPALAVAVGLMMVYRLSSEVSLVNAGPNLVFAAEPGVRAAGLLVVLGLALVAVLGLSHAGRVSPPAPRLAAVARLAWSAAALVLLVRVSTLAFGFPYARMLIAPLLAAAVVLLWLGALVALLAREAPRSAGLAAAGGVGWVLLAVTPIIRGNPPANAYLVALFLAVAGPAVLALAHSAARPGLAAIGGAACLAAWALAPGALGFAAVTRAFAAVVPHDPAWAWAAVAAYPLLLGGAGRLGWRWWSAPRDRAAPVLLTTLVAAAALIAGGLAYDALAALLRPMSG